MFPVDIAKFIRIPFLCNSTGGWFWQSYHGTVKSVGVPVLWFRASTCFQLVLGTNLPGNPPPQTLNLFRGFFSGHPVNFDQKLSRSIAQIIFFYHGTKNFFLAWIDWPRAFDFKICFGKTLIAFNFDKKNLHKALQK